jgi:hypothetical protein
MKLTILFIFLFGYTISQTSLCIPWKNTYIETSNYVQNNETILDFTLRSFQNIGWFAVGFSSSSDPFNNSMIIMSVIPRQVFVLENHTQVKQHVDIFNIQSEQSLDDFINGMTQISFKMNYSLIRNRPFVFFANFEGAILNSNFSTFPRHSSRSEQAIYFDFLKKTAVEDLICQKFFNLPASFVTRNWFGYLSTTIFGILVLFLLLHSEMTNL